MSRLPPGVGISVSDDLKLSIILQAVDNTRDAVASAVANMGKVTEEAQAVSQRAQAALLGGYTDATEQTFAKLKDAFWASKSAPSVEIVPKGAMEELNGFKSAVDALKRDFADVSAKAGGSIELDSGLAKRAAENYKQSQDALRGVKKDVDDLASAGKQAAEKVGEIGSAPVLEKIKAFGSALLLAGAGYKVFSMVKDAVTDAAKLGDEFDKLAARTGVSAEDLAGLKFAAEQNNTTLDAAASAMGKLETKMAAAAAGSKKAAEDLKSIGVTAKEPLEAFRQVSEAIASTKDPIEQSRIATEAFGKGWQSIMGLLKQSPESMDALFKAGQTYYANANAMAENANRYKNSLAEIDTAVGSLKLKFGADLLDPISKIAAGMADAAREGKPFEAALRGIGGAFAEFPITTSITALVGGLAGSAAAIGAWHLAAPALTALFPALAASLPVMAAAAPAVAAMVGAFAAWKVGDAVGTWLKGQIDEMVQAVTGEKAATLGTALYDLIEGPDGVLTWANKVAASGGVWATAGRALMDGLRSGIAAGLKGALGVGEKLSEGIAYIKSTAAQWVQVGRDIIQGLIDGVAAKATEVVNKIRGLGSAVVREMKDLLGIKSPSRIFMAIGEQIGEGMVIGIASTEAAVRAAVEGLGEAAIYAGDEATLTFIRDQEQAVRELRAEMANLGSTASQVGTQGRDWWGRFLPTDAAEALVATGERANEDIGRSLTDALLRGFESGQGYAENFAKTLRDLFGTMVLKPIIQPIVQGAAGLVTGALGSLFSGSAAASTGAAAQGFSGAMSAISGIGSAVTGMIGEAVGGIASALGATTGVATGLGAFAAAAVPVLGAIAALAGLFGGKPSGKYAYGSLDLGTGDVFGRGSQTGEKYSKENNEAVDALLTTSSGYADLLRAMGGTLTGSHRFSVGDTYGYGFDVGEGGKGGFKSDDQAAFIDHVFDTLIAEAEGLDDSLKGLLSTFAGTAEEAVNFATALAAITSFTDADLLGDALEQIRLAGRTAWAQWSDAASAVSSATAAFDGSLSSAQALGTATSAMYQSELALVGQIQGMLVSTSAMFGESIRTIEMSVLDGAGKYDYLRAEIDAAYAGLQAAVDPQAIGDLASQINRLSLEAYGLLDGTQKAEVADEYQAYLEDVNRLTTERLNASQAQVESQHGAMVSAIESALGRVAETMLAAAQAQQAAAATPVTVNSRVSVDVTVDTPASVEVGYS